jgi:hypothetical protein
MLTMRQIALLHEYHNICCEYYGHTVIQNYYSVDNCEKVCIAVEKWQTIWQHLETNTYDRTGIRQISFYNGKLGYYLLQLNILNIIFIIKNLIEIFCSQDIITMVW